MLGISIPLSASVTGSVGLTINNMWGYTKYQIGGNYTVNGQNGNVNFPISELEFPLNTDFASIKGMLDINRKVVIQCSIDKSLFSNAGYLKDSDWGYLYLQNMPGAHQDSLDIYSESKSELDAVIVDLNANYRLVEKGMFSMLLGAGFKYQYFDYRVSNMDQWYPSYNYYFGNTNDGEKYGVYPYHIYESGTVIKYNVSYYIPYLKAAFEIKPIERLLLNGEISFSPYVTAQDYDNHTLRNKISKGDCTGVSLGLGTDARYSFTPHFFAGAELDYLYIFTKGTQTQTMSTYSIDIDQEISSSQLNLSLNLGYNF